MIEKGNYMRVGKKNYVTGGTSSFIHPFIHSFIHSFIVCSFEENLSEALPQRARITQNNLNGSEK